MMGASATLIPIVMALVTLLALFAWHDEYAASAIGNLSFSVVAAAPGDSPSAAVVELASTQPKQEFQTHSETPFWIAFTIPTGINEPVTAELHDRHIINLSCWNSASGEYLGKVINDRADGIVRRAKAGLALSPGALKVSLPLVCRAQFEGPATSDDCAMERGRLQNLSDALPS